MGAIPANVILMWAGANASIPSGWTRQTSLDDKFPKAWGSEDPDTTGGANSHSHTGNVHSHTRTDNHGHSVSLQATSTNSTYGTGGNTDPIAQSNHSHGAATINGSSGGNASDTIAYPAVANNNRPPHYDLIFIKAGAGAVIAEDMIALFNDDELPTNWRACTTGVNGAPALGNKYPRGASTGANGGAIGGSLTHTHDLSHSHSTSHTHTGTSATDSNHPDRSNGSGSGGAKTGQHTHTITLDAATVVTDTYTGSVTSDTVEPEYHKLLAIQRQANSPVSPLGIIALWLGSAASIPKGWQLCNGDMWADGVHQTPDLQDKYVKFANATNEIGNEGGSNTHEHSASNAHTHSQTGSHNHTGSTSANGNSTSNGGATSTASHTHQLNTVGNNDGALSWASSTMSAEEVNNEPEYRTAVYIQLTKTMGSFLAFLQ